MKRTLKKIVLKFFDPLARRLGYRNESLLITNLVVHEPLSKNALLFEFFSILNDINFVAQHIVDVGSNHGHWTREILKHFPNAAYTLVEPQYWLKESVQDLLISNHNIRFFGMGAGKQPGNLLFTVSDSDDCSTFRYNAEEAKEKGFKQITVPVITLNDLIASKNLGIPDIIKIDAEGLDLDVLEGASHFFGKTEIFIVEAAVVCTLINNSFSAVNNYMEERGYRLFDITDLNRHKNPSVLWLVELVFVRRDGRVDNYEHK